MAFKKSIKKEKVSASVSKPKENTEELHINGSIAILKDVEVLFWAYKPVSNNPQYEAKFAVTVKLSDKHLKLLEAAKEAAIQYYCQEDEPELDPDSVEFTDSIYETKTGDVTYTFRSKEDFRKNTEVNAEPCDPDLRIGKGSIANLAVRARASKIFKSYTVTFYLNGANIKHLEEFKGGRINLLEALR